MFRGRRLATAIAAGALLAGGGVVAGCGSSDDGGGTAKLDVLQQAAKKTAAQQSFHLSMSIDQAIAGQSFTIKSEGDYSGGRGLVSLDFGALSKLLGSAPGASGLLDQVGGTSALKATMLTDKDTLLIKMPAIQKGLKTFANRTVPPWASIDVAKLGDTFGIDLSTIFAGSTGSEQTVAYMRALTGSLDTVGEEQIDGVDTTHYRGTIDLANIPKGAVPAAMQKSFDQIAAFLKKSGASTKSPVDVWVGKDDLVRREIITQKIQGTTQKITVNFSDYGKSTTITVPPKSQQFDALALVDELAPGALSGAAQALKGGALGTP